jgi:hypothetical protein
MPTSQQRREELSRRAEEANDLGLLVPVMGDDLMGLLADLAAVERENAELREALQPFAALIDGNLDQVGGGTHIAPTIKVQWVKDAKAALTPPTNAPNPESE